MTDQENTWKCDGWLVYATKEERDRRNRIVEVNRFTVRVEPSGPLGRDPCEDMIALTLAHEIQQFLNSRFANI